MIKRTIFIGNPAYLSLKLGQLVIKLPDAQGMDEASGRNKIPIEDIGVLMLDHPQITLTQALLAVLLDHNIAVITCRENHMPVGLWLPLEGHTLQQERFSAQIQASLPLKKQLWQQTVQAKIRNQTWLLDFLGKSDERIRHMIQEVRSGDPDNREALAAAIYWRRFFYPRITDFTRSREGDFPNNFLNYGYAILRAVMARSLTGAGLLPTFGIHHHNKYNAYCLADDMMEPYRPVIDKLVWQVLAKYEGERELSPAIKREFLLIPILDVWLDGERSPLMNACQRTAASLARCYEGKTRKLIFPALSDAD